MRRVTKQVKVGANRVRYLVGLFNEPSPEEGPESVYRQHELLRMMVDQPALMNCGPAPMQRLRLFYTGQEWAAELEAVVDTSEAFRGTPSDAA